MLEAAFQSVLTICLFPFFFVVEYINVVKYINVFCLMHTLLLEDDLGTLSVIIILLFCLQLLNLIYSCSLIHRVFFYSIYSPRDLGAFKQGSHGMGVPGTLSKMERPSLCIFRRMMCLVFKRLFIPQRH